MARLYRLALVVGLFMALSSSPRRTCADDPQADPNAAPLKAETAPKSVELGRGRAVVNEVSRLHVASEYEVGFLEAYETYARAVQRLALVLEPKLVERKMLLVWVVGTSATMSDDREQLAVEIPRFHTLLENAAKKQSKDEGKDDALSVGVLGFGVETYGGLKQPSIKPEEIATAIKDLTPDPSQLVNQCKALKVALTVFRPIAEAEDRRLVLVLVSDESGDMTDNIAKIEQTVAVLKEAKCEVHVVGREAVFGYPYVYVDDGIDEETKEPRRRRLTRGPDVAIPETLQLNGYRRRIDAQASGFGPYEQMRIVNETGGRFFILPSPDAPLHCGSGDFYEPLKIAPYRPELTSRVDYTAAREASPLARETFQIVTDLNPYMRPSPGRIVVEVRTSGFSIYPVEFAKQAGEEIKKAEALIVYYEAAQKRLEALAPEREHEKSVRRRAVYDLLSAQVVAYQARLREYVLCLADFEKNPRRLMNALGPAKPTNRWSAKVSATLRSPEATTALRQKAEAMFRAIRREHAGTPWADAASEEIDRPYGLELIEAYEPPRRILIPTFK